MATNGNKSTRNSSGMFVSSGKFVEEHGGREGHIAVYGQKSNYTAWKLARINLANLGPRKAESFRAVLHPELKADLSWPRRASA